jgi:hypothetical protein
MRLVESAPSLADHRKRAHNVQGITLFWCGELVPARISSTVWRPTSPSKEWMRPGYQKLDLRQAPLGWLQIAADVHGQKWYALLQLHHLMGMSRPCQRTGARSPHGSLGSTRACTMYSTLSHLV